ncbi:AAA family ATPase [Chitinibacter tainanensis]|uniref:AAA family ATPase n=1 Tax=Chitinibacter tainanensis TaxID=230667 RepID=UPI0004052094|nr:AAA family ATPase [Chitinibacter tainanensis]
MTQRGHIILVGTEKGGVGKSTLAVNTAAYLKQKGFQVVIVDTDTQPTTNTFIEQRAAAGVEPHIPCYIIQGEKKIARDLLGLAEQFQFVVVDAGGRDSVELRETMLVCDTMIAPTEVGLFETWALKKTASLVNDVNIIRGEGNAINVHAVLNCAPTNPFLRNRIDRAIEFITHNFPQLNLAETIIHNRVAYSDAALFSMGIVEVPAEVKDAKAVKELVAFLEEIGL